MWFININQVKIQKQNLYANSQSLHIIYWYTVSTAVDVINNESAIENITMNWKEGGLQSDMGKGNILLTNENTQQQILLCDESNAYEAIKSWAPETVVVLFSLHIF